MDSKNGLIQGISDNFDDHLCTQNGLKQTHSLAAIITQHSSSTNKVKREPIKWLKKHQLGTVPLDDVNMKIYSGEKKPQMPASFGKFGVLPLRVLCHQIIITRKSQNDDFEFIQESLKDSNTPDFSGYNTRRTRETGQTKQLKTRILYKPLINKTPADPSTILTAMCDLGSTSRQAGQCMSLFTCDQHLYRVALDIVWADPERWSDFYPRIGDMHWLMSFVGCVRKLMGNSGLEKVMKVAFAGVEKMLIGKKFPMNVRALRIVSLELLRGFTDELSYYDDLVAFLNDLSSKSRLAEHWINNLIRPVMLIMLYISALALIC